MNTLVTRMALIRAHTSAKATDPTKLLLKTYPVWQGMLWPPIIVALTLTYRYLDYY